MTSPEASVETIIFGSPIGRERMPRVTIDVPALPPIPMIASKAPKSTRNLSNASLIAATAAPLSRPSRNGSEEWAAT